MNNPSDDEAGTGDCVSRDNFDPNRKKGEDETSARPKREAVGKYSSDELQTRDSIQERRLQRRRELKRLCKMRRRRHRKEVAKTLEREVSRLTAEYNLLRAENEDLRKEWDRCMRAPRQRSNRASSQLEASRFTLPQQRSDVRAPAAQNAAFSRPYLNVPPSFLDSSAVGFQLFDSQLRAPLLACCPVTAQLLTICTWLCPVIQPQDWAILCNFRPTVYQSPLLLGFVTRTCPG